MDGSGAHGFAGHFRGPLSPRQNESEDRTGSVDVDVHAEAPGHRRRSLTPDDNNNINNKNNNNNSSKMSKAAKQYPSILTITASVAARSAVLGISRGHRLHQHRMRTTATGGLDREPGTRPAAGIAGSREAAFNGGGMNTSAAMPRKEECVSICWPCACRQRRQPGQPFEERCDLMI